jgi:hypothetical protein
MSGKIGFCCIPIFAKNWRFARKSAFFVKISVFREKYFKIGILQKSEFLQKSSFFAKNT